MAAPFTQIFIQAQIDLYVSKMETATTQEYRYTQQTGSDLDIRRQNIEDLQKVLDGWISKMDKYYPDAFSDGGNQIDFWTVGINEG